ncbi:Mycobacterial 4 TMS phage holin, superfamily IV [Calidithermus terrae]|uniref:Mycobacterial 4 TMS phage holin, superfamily IV n=1 Tax=Calidithermus terrae TaxID=1408545 RepID=A0A399F720_9DEIN|nr:MULTISPECIES: phage holin family protein [Calidithermus]RIH90431.1 Mycobacterial 4 TMS phage holin, superfamily IV [Calidithermus terrae]
MRNLLIRLIVNTVALWVVSSVYGGVRFAPGSGLGDYLLAGLVLGLVNTFIRPILLLLTLPINLLTLGLFTLVINAVVLMIVAAFTSLDVGGFISALVGAVLLTVVSYFLNLVFGDKR